MATIIWFWGKPHESSASVTTMDAITIQILRNKIARLVDEMHYHFYRSGYPTIIRESRHCSCVIDNRTGRPIVSPPPSFHEPASRQPAGRIIQPHDARNDPAGADVRVSNH